MLQTMCLVYQQHMKLVLVYIEKDLYHHQYLLVCHSLYNIIDYGLFLELPTPFVTITTNGDQFVGGTYTITCTVNIIQPLIASLTIQWNKLISNVLNTLSGNTVSSLTTFTSLNTSDAGIYTCQATVSISDIATTINSTNTTIQLQSKSFLNNVLHTIV